MNNNKEYELEKLLSEKPMSDDNSTKLQATTLKFGNIVLEECNWQIIFKCEFCNKDFRHLKSFLIHSLNHVYDINDEAIDLLYQGIDEQDFKINVQEVSDINGESDTNKDVIYYEDENIEERNDKTTDGFMSDKSTIITTDNNIIDESIEFLVEDDIGFEKDFLTKGVKKTKHATTRKTTNRPKVKIKPETKNTTYNLECPVCNKVFFKSDSLKHHVRRHKVKYACDMCDAVFNDGGNLKRHRNRHLGIKQYSCKICDKQFTTTTEVKLHMRIHTGERPYVCEECGASFATSSPLILHQRRSHTHLRPYECESCSQSFYTNMELKEHIRVHNKKPFECIDCGKMYKRIRSLARHRKIHEPVTRHICKYCNSEFEQYLSLHWHIKQEHR